MNDAGYLDRLLRRIDELPAESKGEAPIESVAFEEFEVLGELGRGGMGVVYIARQKSLRRLVALKFLPAHQLLSPSARERLRREAQAISRLHHPHLVRIHAVGEKDGAPFLAMEFVPGVPLSALLERLWSLDPKNLHGPDLYRAFQDAWHGRFAKLDGLAREFSPHQQTENPFWFQSYDRILAHWTRQIAEALHAAHKCEVLHRDVKPSNILITAAGDAVLADFGLAWEGGAESMTKSEEFVGTLHYAAPEAILGKEGQRSPASDIYSLGMVLYESLTLSNPFEGESRAQTIHRIATAEPEKVRKRNATVDPSVETICMKAIEKEPLWRYKSARDMAADLDRFFAGQAVEPSTIGELTRAMRRVRRHPWTPWVLTTAALAAGAAGIWLGVTGGEGFDQKRWDALPPLSASQREISDACASTLASYHSVNFKLFQRVRSKLEPLVSAGAEDVMSLALLAMAQKQFNDGSHLETASILLNKHSDSAKARELVQKLIPELDVASISPGERKVSVSPTRELELELCLRFLDGNLEKTRQTLEEITVEAPDEAWPRLSLGFASILTLDAIQFSKGEKELRRYLQRALGDALANTALGFIVLNGVHSKEAGPYFESALAADPSLWPAKDLLERWKEFQKKK